MKRIRSRRWLAGAMLVLSLAGVACEGSAEIDAPNGGEDGGGGEGEGGGGEVDVDVGNDEGGDN